MSTRAWLRRCWLAAAVLASAGAAAAAKDAAPDSAVLDAAFEETMRRYRLPGLALGVIVDGEVVYRRAGGELVAGEGEAIDTATLFKIASNSKAMTTALLARLVDAGKLRWDDPVRRHLPQLRMHDPWVTEHMQVRDLLLHNSGLGEGAGDLMLWPEPNDFTRADVIAGLAHLRLVHSFRSHYAYDNILYIVAGEVAAAVAGEPWEDLMQREVFAPLGMQRCQAGGFDSAAVGNVAQAHMQVDGRNVPIRRDEARVPTITSAAAGGIRCSLEDMLAWARMWLGDERHADWLSVEQREAVWTGHMPMRVSGRQRAWDGTRFHAYGYGWRLSDVDGEFVAAHTGTLGGMYSALVLLPDRDSGFVLMTNGNGSEARTVLTQVLLDQFTDRANARDVAQYAALLAAGRDGAAAHSPALPDTSGRTPAAPTLLDERLGVYRDPWFGAVALCAAGDRVRFEAQKSPRMAGTLMQVGEALLVDWDLPSVDAEAWLHFGASGPLAGRVRGDGASAAPADLTLSHVDPDADFSFDYADLGFRRVADCPPAAASSPVPVSTADTAAAAGMVDVATLVPAIDLDIRYAGNDNFTGGVVDGYQAPKCYLLAGAAAALREVAERLRADGLRLRVFDCYRPVRAVHHFVRWARDGGEQRSKAAYYPNLEKSALLDGYIAESSGHSRGGTIDLTLLQCATPDAADGRNGAEACRELDMGTPFDFFDPLANTDDPRITPAQARNRQRLRQAMARGGFANYPLEWWHYTWQGVAADAPAHDVVVR